MYADLIKPKAYPDLLQKPDYDPCHLIPTPFPPHPRVLATAAQLDRTIRSIGKGGLPRRMFDALAKACPTQVPPLPQNSAEHSTFWAHRALATALYHRLGGPRAQRTLAIAALRRCVAAFSQIKDGFFSEPEMLRWAASAFDLLMEKGLPAPIEAEIREGFYSVAALLKRCTHSTCNNHNNFNISSRLAMASALGDTRWFHDALYGLDEAGQWRYGLIHALRHDILDDGMQWEGTHGYHMLVLTAIAECATLLENVGIDIWHRSFPSAYQDDGFDQHRGWGRPGNQKNLQAAFDAFFFQAFPNGSYTLLHDEVLGNIHGAWVWWPLFKKAFEVYRDPKYAWLLNRMETHYPDNSPDPRPRWLALSRSLFDFVRLDFSPLPKGHFSFSDPAHWSAEGRHEQGCSLFPVHGSALLRAQPDSEQSPAAYLYWGPHWAGHRGPAALHLEIQADGQRLTTAPHLPKNAYDIPNYLTWNRTTIAHNTVTVDGKPMFPFDFETQSIWETDTWRDHTSDSELISFQPEKTFKAIRVANRQVYPGVVLDRSVLMTRNYLIDLFRVSSDEPHQYDWAQHILGTWAHPASGKPCTLGDQRGYRHFIRAQTLSFTPGWQALEWTRLGRSHRLHLFLPSTHQWISAHTPVPDDLTPIGEGVKPQPRTTLIHRAREKSTFFLAVWNFTPRRPLQLKTPRISPAGLQLDLAGTRGDDTRWFFPLVGPMVRIAPHPLPRNKT
jgi:hypothetical protein